MNELLELLSSYLRGMWHRRWVGLAAAWLVGIVAVGVAFKIPERYEASARVYVDTDSLLRPLLAGLAIQPNVDQQVALMSRTLISRPNVEKLVRQADLDLNVRSAAARDELIDNVSKNIKLDGTRLNNLYTITYRDVNAERARKVVQSLLQIFVESSLGNKQKDTQNAFNFVEDQIKRYEESLRQAETRLKDFKLKYMGVNTTREGQDYFTRMGQLGAQVEAARMELAANEQTRDSYKRDLAGEAPLLVPEAGPAPEQSVNSPELDMRIGVLHKELDELSRKYTDNHPDVEATRRRLKELEEQRAADIEERRKRMPKTTTAANVERSPVYEQLRISLAQAEAAVAASRAKLSNYEGQYAALKAKAQLVPQVEQEYAELNRDYDVQKKTYESLLARRDAANLGKDVQDTGGAQVRVIDPPRVSGDPVPPTRTMLVALAFAVAALAGMIASLVASQVWPTFHTPRVLREITKRPLLGMVSMLPDPRIVRARRRGNLLFAGGLGGLLMTMTAVMTFAILIGRTA